jgi:hypothetical protein
VGSIYEGLVCEKEEMDEMGVCDHGGKLETVV